MTSVDDLLARLEDIEIDVDERHRTAQEVAALGDPRITGELIDVPAGTLFHRESRDAPIEPVPLHAFAIQRHLVTVAEYAAFIDAGGYDDPALWSADGWSWRLDNDVEKPRFWADEEWAPYLHDNSPVVGVSWYEADAYASFRELRLPTEREWERAARGDDGRLFPWGDTWDPRRCAHRDNGMRTTKPIGIFPPGPFALYDMVGSVWQWTDGDGAHRVVRGGAWNNLPWSIGCASRNAYPPGAQFSNLGFRCAK